MKPLIGIPLCHDANDRIRRGRQYLYSDIAYTRAVVDAGGTAVHLPIQHDPGALIERIDGLLLPGGDDFLPAVPYPDPSVFDAASEAQIAFDRGLLVAALERGLPILGICYGAQLITLNFGGTLHYHLPEDLPAAAVHQLDEAHGRHAIEISSDSRLGALIGSGPASVNSLHHQAIANPGLDLRAVAHSSDRVIEAIEHPEHPFCVGVQWHPEKLDEASSRKLFAGFVAAAAQFATH